MKKNYNIENVNVCFHIGLGGHFHKAGCKSLTQTYLIKNEL